MRKFLLLLPMLVFFVQVTFAQDYALFFDAATENQSFKYSEDATTQLMDGATNYTIEAWVRPTNDTEFGQVIMSYRNMFRLTFWKNATDDGTVGRVYFTHKLDNLDDGTSDDITNTFINTNDAVINVNQWNHIAVICDATDGGSGSIKIYVNGADVTLQHYDALPLDGGATNNDVFVGYGGGNYPNMYAREIRVKNIAENISNLVTDDVTNAYSTDANTSVLFHCNEGSGVNTTNSASGISFEMGYSGAHYPTFVALSSLSVNEVSNKSLNIYPNPTTETITINLSDITTASELTIFDNIGRNVYLQDLNANQENVTINVSNFSAGLYHINITSNNSIHSTKFSVVK